MQQKISSDDIGKGNKLKYLRFLHASFLTVLSLALPAGLNIAHLITVLFTLKEMEVIKVNFKSSAKKL